MTQGYKFRGDGLNTAQRKKGKRKFDKYCKIYNYEKINDLEILESLVYHEINIIRIKDKIEDLNKSKTVTDAEVLPKKLYTRLSEIEDQSLKLREKLGLFEDKKVETPLKHLQVLEKKFEKWMGKNQASREIVCPFCAKLFFLRMRTDKYKAYKSSFFEDKILCNRALHKVYKQGKITKDEYSAILGVPKDYIDWLQEKYFDKVSAKS